MRGVHINESVVEKYGFTKPYIRSSSVTPVETEERYPGMPPTAVSEKENWSGRIWLTPFYLSQR